MATKKTILKDKNVDELTTMLGDARTNLRELRFASAGSRSKDAGAAARAHKEVARLLTELGSRAKNA